MREKKEILVNSRKEFLQENAVSHGESRPRFGLDEYSCIYKVKRE